MAKINGSQVLVRIDETKFLHSTNATLTVNQDLPDATDKDSGGWADHINGLRDWSITVEGYAIYDATSGNVVDAADLILDRETGDAEFTPDATGDLIFSGEVSLASLELGAEMEATATISTTFTGKGPLAKATVSA